MRQLLALGPPRACPASARHQSPGGKRRCHREEIVRQAASLLRVTLGGGSLRRNAQPTGDRAASQPRALGTGRWAHSLCRRPPCGQYLWGQTYSIQELDLGEQGGRGALPKQPLLHLQLLFPEAYRLTIIIIKSLPLICEVKVLGKAQRSGSCISLHGLCAPAPPHQHPGESLRIRSSSRNQTGSQLLHKHLIYTRVSSG